MDLTSISLLDFLKERRPIRIRAKLGLPHVVGAKFGA